MHYRLVGLMLVAITFLGKAQTPTDVEEISLSLWYKADTPFTKVVCRLRLTSYQDDSATFQFAPRAVGYVKLRQGRLKQDLPFKARNGELLLSWPAELDERSEIEIAYTLQRDSLLQSVFADSIAGGWVVNPLSMLKDSEIAGQIGLLYPAIAGDAHHLNVNISLPEGKKAGVPAELRYKVQQTGVLSYFYESQEEIQPGQFFLAIGDFEEFDPEKLDEKYLFSETTTRQIAAQLVRSQIGQALDFYASQEGHLFDDQALRQIKKNAQERHFTGFFLDSLDSEKPTQMRLEKAAALQVTNGDTTVASTLHYRFYVHAKGTNWQRHYLQTRYQQPAKHNEFFWQEYLNYYLAGDGAELADTVSRAQDIMYNKGRQAALALAREVYRQQSPMQVNLRYSFVSRDSSLYLYLKQPDSTVTFGLPLKVEVVTSDTSYTFQKMARLGLRDTIAIPFTQSPRSINSTLPSEFTPVHLDQQRPDTYLLYDLGHASDPAQKQKALVQLFETTNENLLATIIGIALREGSSVIQVQALQKVSELEESGRAKLKSTIEKIAHTGEASKAKIQAQSILEEYYN